MLFNRLLISDIGMKAPSVRAPFSVITGLLTILVPWFILLASTDAALISRLQQFNKTNNDSKGVS